MSLVGKEFRRHIAFLKNKGIESAERDVTLILNFVLGFTDNQYIFNQDRAISKLELTNLDRLIARRANHEPVAKIIGKKLFWNSSFLVDNHVLDPRPETEVLVQSVLSNVGRSRTLLDLGTGSGCVAISLALMLNQLSIFASDISEKALNIASQNAKKNNAEVHFILSDWFVNIKGRFDIIVSNPPYISKADFDNLSLDVKKYDPKLSLIGGEDGLDCYRAICESLSKYLTNEGLAFFEIGFGQRENIVDLCSQSGVSLFEVYKDLNGFERVICVKKDA